MGKIPILTKEQEIILDEIGQDDFLRKKFYFTGGTALSAFYLQHRYSEDLDLFSQEQFDAQEILGRVSKWAKKHNFEVTRRQIENVHIYLLKFTNGETLKIDFVYYPYRRLEKGALFKRVEVNSLLDISVNKLLTINQRAEVKDFVDLYFLLKRYTIWDLIEGLRVKFRMKTEPFFVAGDFLKVEEFEALPRMIQPLTLAQLKAFFKEKAIEIGKRVVE